jgi:hypothetical protein
MLAGRQKVLRFGWVWNSLVFCLFCFYLRGGDTIFHEIGTYLPRADSERPQTLVTEAVIERANSEPRSLALPFGLI